MGQYMRVPFTVGKISGDACLRSSGPGYTLYEVVLGNGEIFTLEQVQASEGTIWCSMPMEKYSILAEKIGRKLERAAA